MPRRHIIRTVVAWVWNVPAMVVGWLRLPTDERPFHSEAMALSDECGETDLANCFGCVAFNGHTCPGAPRPDDEPGSRKKVS